jgi:hypothetical protein
MGRQKPGSICLSLKLRAVASARITTRHVLRNHHSGEEVIIDERLSTDRRTTVRAARVILSSRHHFTCANGKHRKGRFSASGSAAHEATHQRGQVRRRVGRWYLPIWGRVVHNMRQCLSQYRAHSVWISSRLGCPIRDLVLREDSFDVIRCNGLLITTHP